MDSISEEKSGETTEAGRARRRSVVSYVLRSGRLTSKLQKAWDEYAPQFVLDIPRQDSELDVADGFTFDRAFLGEQWGAERAGNPFIIEIGTGQGENIVAAAAANPGTNYLALEVFEQGIAHTLAKIGKFALSNLRIARVNAPELIASCEDALASEVWTYFPDPWPKMKHHKRRIVNAELATQVARVLGDGGLWRIATDIDDYALHVHEVLDGDSRFRHLGGVTVSLATSHVGKGTADDAVDLPHAEFTESERFDGRVLTSFERKGLEAGHTIHDFTYQRV